MLSSPCFVDRERNKTHPRAQVARAEDVVYPPRDQQRPEAGREGRRPVRDVEVADAEDEHHWCKTMGERKRKRGKRERREEGN